MPFSYAISFTLLQKAVEALIRAQARLDHARNGAAAKQAARDAAAALRDAADEALQARCAACRTAAHTRLLPALALTPSASSCLHVLRRMPARRRSGRARRRARRLKGR